MEGVRATIDLWTVRAMSHVRIYAAAGSLYDRESGDQVCFMLYAVVTWSHYRSCELTWLRSSIPILQWDHSLLVFKFQLVSHLIWLRIKDFYLIYSIFNAI